MKVHGFPQPDREPEPSREIGSCDVTALTSLIFSFVKWVEKKKIQFALRSHLYKKDIERRNKVNVISHGGGETAETQYVLSLPLHLLMPQRAPRG